MFLFLLLLGAYLVIGFVANIFAILAYSETRNDFLRYEKKVGCNPKSIWMPEYKKSAKNLQSMYIKMVTMTFAWFPWLCVYLYSLLSEELATLNRATSAVKDEDNG